MIPRGEMPGQAFDAHMHGVNPAIAAALLARTGAGNASGLDPAIATALHGAGATVAPQPYVSPTARAQGFLGSAYAQRLGQRGIDPAQVLRNQASAYARQRLGQLQAVSSMLPDELRTALGAADLANPEAAWRALSSSFAAYSKNAGVADPRAMLRQLLAARRAGAGGRS